MSFSDDEASEVREEPVRHTGEGEGEIKRDDGNIETGSKIIR